MCDRMDVPWSEIRLERSPRGKPYLAAPLKGNRVSLKCLWRFNFKAELNFQTALKPARCLLSVHQVSRCPLNRIGIHYCFSLDLVLDSDFLMITHNHSMISLQAGSSPPHGALIDSHGSFTAHNESLGL